jgi:serine/threonine protein kinase
MADTDLKKLLYEDRFKSHCADLVELLLESRNLLDALDFLHRGQIIEGEPLTFCHMDLKLDNILVYDLNEKKWPELKEAKYPAGCWKISDFGISSTSPHAGLGKASRNFAAASLTVITESAALISNLREAGPYSAPEVHQGDMVGTPSDVWSIGCILFQVLARGIGIEKCKWLYNGLSF